MLERNLWHFLFLMHWYWTGRVVLSLPAHRLITVACEDVKPVCNMRLKWEMPLPALLCSAHCAESSAQTDPNPYVEVKRLYVRLPLTTVIISRMPQGSWFFFSSWTLRMDVLPLGFLTLEAHCLTLTNTAHLDSFKVWNLEPLPLVWDTFCVVFCLLANG